MYWDLVALQGPRIAAPVVLEYYDGPFRLVARAAARARPRPGLGGGGVFFQDVLLAEWTGWFEHKDHEETPDGGMAPDYD